MRLSPLYSPFDRLVAVAMNYRYRDKRPTPDQAKELADQLYRWADERQQQEAEFIEDERRAWSLARLKWEGLK